MGVNGQSMALAFPLDPFYPSFSRGQAPLRISTTSMAIKIVEDKRILHSLVIQMGSNMSL